MKSIKPAIVVFITLFISTIGISQDSEIRSGLALEVLQVSSYTYILSKEDDGAEKWIVAPSFEALAGVRYYYKGGTEMTSFRSTELGRTFESVLFLEVISSDRMDMVEKSYSHAPHGGSEVVQKIVEKEQQKLSLNIAPASGGISIAALRENKELYEGKTVIIRGQVTKCTSNVMYKNWIHLQDGTEFDDEFDITITSSSEAKIGDVITVEGLVSLNKDFGYGYSYSLLIENAVIVR